MADRDGQDVAIINTSSGEMRKLFDLAPALADAEPLELATLIAEVESVRQDLSEFDDLARGALLRHLDQSGEWTKRYGDIADGVQYEVTAPSPTAGVDSYADLELEAQLRALVDAKVINLDGAAKAIDRKIVIELRVPLAEDLEALTKRVAAAKEIRLAGVLVEMAKVTPSRSVKLPGVKALLKVAGTAEAIGKAYRARPPGNRRPKVTAIRKGE